MFKIIFDSIQFNSIQFKIIIHFEYFIKKPLLNYLIQYIYTIQILVNTTSITNTTLKKSIKSIKKYKKV